MSEPDDDLEVDFPRGDGTADTAAVVRCPHCGAAVEIALDPGGGPEQEYVEDCDVCCRPWHLVVRYGPRGDATVDVRSAAE
jgi:hypothetical protein